MHTLHNGLMKQGLADISIPQRNLGEAQCSHQIGKNAGAVCRGRNPDIVEPPAYASSYRSQPHTDTAPASGKEWFTICKIAPHCQQVLCPQAAGSTDPN